jgi:hypothetical protein
LPERKERAMDSPRLKVVLMVSNFQNASESAAPEIPSALSLSGPRRRPVDGV